MRPRKSSLITKLVLLAILLYAVATVAALQPKLEQLKQQRSTLRDEIAELEDANAQLQEDSRALGTDDSVRKLARERLNLLEDGDRIFIDSSK